LKRTLWQCPSRGTSGQYNRCLRRECAARIIGAEQMLLGSDYPLSNDPAGVLELAVNNVRGSALSEAQKHTICCGNAQQLFGLDRLRTLSRAATS
jgi:predicted TIM-barrel fold metal-dependent hydrolase